jgi:hypothetical protein
MAQGKQEISLSFKAYGKIVAHVLKHPQTILNGVLIGTIIQEGDSESILVQDAIPLFHTSINLSLPLEVAIAQIKSYCQSRNLNIIGYYHCHHSASSEVTEQAKATFELLKSHSLGTFLLFCVDSKAIYIDSDDSGVSVYEEKNSAYKQVEGIGNLSISGHSKVNIVKEALRKTKALDVNDFDDHLDDISKGWLNDELNATLKKAERVN